jgi:vancomycin permeability regulator SanA
MKKKKLLKIAIIILIICITAGIAALILNAYVKNHTKGRIIDANEAARLSDVDCILVLGCGVNPDGSLSYMLRDRLNLAYDVYTLGASDKLLMSGDHGKTDYNEVRAMKEYVMNQGVTDESAIFMDHAGFSTYESIYRANEIFGAKKILIISNTYHLYRSLYIAEQLGIEAYGVGVPDKYSGKEYREFREILARDKDFIKCIFKPEPTFLGEKIDIHGDGTVTDDEK